ncbi:MAG: tetratricopeptide repeat protein [Acidobacteriia bacterium]|nr:tetratricopeptide repeat protein [Terriglobia bacterium]
MAGRITRKELKTDKFALEVGQTVDFVTGHRRELILWGSIAATVVVVGLGIYLYMRHEHTVREQALGDAVQMQEAPVATPNSSGRLSFPTDEAKQNAVTKAFTDIATRFSGSSEAAVAKYYLGSIAADQGKMADAEKWFKESANEGDKNYASLAQFSLGQAYFAEGRPADAEKILRYLMDHSTVFVSKEQATIALAKGIAPTKLAEAIKLLEPLRVGGGPVAQNAITAIGELTGQQ